METNYSAYEWKQAYRKAAEIVAAVRAADEGRYAPPSFIDLVPSDAETVVAEMIMKENQA